MKGHKIHGWLLSGYPCVGERYEPEPAEIEAAVLPNPAQRSAILALLKTLFLLNKLKSLRETAWYTYINCKTWSWNSPATILLFLGDTKEIHDGYPIKQGLCTTLVLLFQDLLFEGLHYFFIHKLQNSATSLFTFEIFTLARFVIHTPI